MKENRNSFSSYDCYLFHEGSHFKAYEKMGAHIRRENGVSGVRFCLWAPNAQRVCALCERTGWSKEAGEMTKNGSGIWECFIPGVKAGDRYRYMIVGCDGITRFKSDPYAFRSEMRPETCSIVSPLSGYKWGDGLHMAAQSNKTVTEKPMAIYEVHLGSWKRDSRYEDGFINYRVLADELANYVLYMGYTHVELIGICEYPFDGSWGYQVTGFFSPTSRYGSPNDFKYFVDRLHQCGIGVILDWVPAHFPKDAFGLETLDGSAMYESADPLMAEYPEWGTKAFDHSKGAVRSFLLSSAYYWVKEFHIDALRVDAVASMLHTSFGRSQWRVNADGSTENHESTEFLRMVNKTITKKTKAYLIAEDSSIKAGITDPVEEGGMGFKFKWNMGWMNDTLKYIETDPVYRHWEHGKLTHTASYAFLENFVLVLSHDEVVHLKKPMLKKAPGAAPDQYATLKSLYTFQFTHPGKKLLFMGQDFAEDREWDENREINWGLASDFSHRDVMQCVKNLLGLYRDYPVLHNDSRNPVTFEWVNSMDSDRNLLSYIRRNPWNYEEALLVICNFSPVPHFGYRCGVPMEGYYKRIFSTYDSLPGSGGPGELGDIPPLQSIHEPCDGREFCISYDLRPFESLIIELPKKKKED